MAGKDGNLFPRGGAGTISSAEWVARNRSNACSANNMGMGMSKAITLRYQQIGDAKRFVEILNNPNFLYFPARPQSIEAEKAFLRKNIQARREGRDLNYSILLGKKVVGAIGLKIELQRPYLGEIGYFVDEAYWGRGIASRALELVERIAFEEKGLVRIEILMVKKNKASERVTIKCGYKKEGIAKGKLLLFGKYEDAYVYAKVRKADDRK